MDSLVNSILNISDAPGVNSSTEPAPQQRTTAQTQDKTNVQNKTKDDSLPFGGVDNINAMAQQGFCPKPGESVKPSNTPLQECQKECDKLKQEYYQKYSESCTAMAKLVQQYLIDNGCDAKVTLYASSWTPPDLCLTDATQSVAPNPNSIEVVEEETPALVCTRQKRGRDDQAPENSMEAENPNLIQNARSYTRSYTPVYRRYYV